MNTDKMAGMVHFTYKRSAKEQKMKGLKRKCLTDSC